MDTRTRPIVSGILLLMTLCFGVPPVAHALSGPIHWKTGNPLFDRLGASNRQKTLIDTLLHRFKEADPDSESAGFPQSGWCVAMQMGSRLDFLSGSPLVFRGRPAAVCGELRVPVMTDTHDPLELSPPDQTRMAGLDKDDTVSEPENWNEETQAETIPDPLEPLNRVFFRFNDRLYFWVLKPVARGYRYVLPEPLRVCVRNAFTNLGMPIRAVNCLLQGKIRGFGRELLRFVVNSTAGFLGFVDAARIAMHVQPQNEDFGQTLGFYGIGPGFYIDWPILGPSSVRGTFGMAGDYFVDPVNYLAPKLEENIEVRGGDMVNRTSLTLGEYESLKKSALDPYVALKNAYFQYRQNQISK